MTPIRAKTNQDTLVQMMMRFGLVAGLFLVSLGGLAQSTGLDAARASFAEYETNMKASAEAAARQESATAKELEDKALVALRRAARQYGEAGAGESDSPELLRHYADVQMRLGDYDLCAETLSRLVTVSPGDVDARLLLGNALAEAGPKRANEAIAAIGDALAMKPEPAKAAAAHLVLGRIYRGEKLFDLARGAFEQALTVEPSNAGAHVALAAEKLRMGQVAEASAELDQAGSQITPEVGAQMGALLKEALADFREMRLSFPDTAANHYAYAKLLLRGNRVPDALMAAERSAALDGTVFEVWNFLGDVSRLTGNVKRAREAYEKSLQLKPEQPATVKSLEELAGK